MTAACAPARAGVGWTFPGDANRSRTRMVCADRGQQMKAPAQGPPQSPAEVVILRSDYPALCQSASDTSRHGQQWYRRFVLANLILLVAGAALSGIIGLFSDRFAVPFAMLIILTLLCAMAANFVNWRRDDDDDWFLGRAVAES